MPDLSPSPLFWLGGFCFFSAKIEALKKETVPTDSHLSTGGRHGIVGVNPEMKLALEEHEVKKMVGSLQQRMVFIFGGVRGNQIPLLQWDPSFQEEQRFVCEDPRRILQPSC